MKKFICLLGFLLLLTNCSFADEVQMGGVSYDVNSARDYLDAGQPDSVDINAPREFSKDSSVQKVIYTYNNNHAVIGITVLYKNEPTKDYIYNKNNSLIYVDKYDKSTAIYPHRGYRYDMDGKLILKSLVVSPNEQFRFSPNGKLIAHSLNGIIYDEKGNVIGAAK